MKQKFKPDDFRILFDEYHRNCENFNADWFSEKFVHLIRKYNKIKQCVPIELRNRYQIYEYTKKHGDYTLKYLSARLIEDGPPKSVKSTNSKSITRWFRGKKFNCRFDFKPPRKLKKKYDTYEEAQFFLNLYVHKMLHTLGVIPLNTGAPQYKNKMRNFELRRFNKYYNPSLIRTLAVFSYPSLYVSFPPLNRETIFMAFQVITDLVNEFGKFNVKVIDENTIETLEETYLFVLFIDNGFVHESQLRHRHKFLGAEESIKVTCIDGINHYEELGNLFPLPTSTRPQEKIAVDCISLH